MRVLLVEDDLTAARGISLMLKSSGAVVDHTDTGDAGSARGCLSRTIANLHAKSTGGADRTLTDVWRY